MVSDQLSSKNNAGSEGPLSAELLDSIVNLVELSNSELTLSTGGESLPVTGLLLDALLDLLGDRRPDLLEHAQRIGYVCAGIAGQLKWTHKWTNNLVCAGLLHELGTLTLPSPQDYWNSIGTADERFARNVSIDFLEATHGDSDLLDILALSHNFRYRTHVDEDTPRYVLQGAAALSAVRFFETCRVLPENPRQAPELLAALRTVYNSSGEEIEVIDALESWLQSETDENFDPSMFLPSTMSNDPETAEIVRETFLEILDTFRVLHSRFDSFFMLDGTGRFQIWSSKSEQFLGRSVRSMRNTHWSNEIVKYCNEEGFPFSDAQTPLYQTLTTGKSARLHLCMQDIGEKLFEVEVVAIPIIGRDQLMQAILEFHKSRNPRVDQDSKILQTATDIAELASQLLGQFEQDPEQHPLPAVSFDKIDAFEERLRNFTFEAPPPEQEQEPEPEPELSDSSIFSDDATEVEISLDEREIAQSDVLTDEEKSDDFHEPESEELAPQEQMSDAPDDLMSRIDSMMSEVGEPKDEESDLSVTDSTIILKSSITDDSSNAFADEEFLSEEPETQNPEPAPHEQVQQVEEFAVEDTPASDEKLHPEFEDQKPAISEPAELETWEEQPLVDETAEAESQEPVVEPQAADFDREPTDAIETEPEPVEEQRPESAPSAGIHETSPPESELEQPVVEEELIASDDRQTEPVQPETVEAAAAQTEQSTEKSSSDSDFEITSSPSEEPAVSPHVEHEPEPVVEKPSVCPTPLVVPELQPETAEEQPAAESVEEEKELVEYREWEEYVKAVMDKSSPLHESIGVLLLEIDELESVIREFGKQIVEDLMIEFNRRLANVCSTQELSCRYGGGQFAVACPGLELKAAYKRGDQLRHLFEKTRFDVMPIKKLTVSVGVTVAEPPDSFDTLIQRVEYALTRSRKIGNNCCLALDSEEVRNEKRKEQDEEGSRILVNEFVLTAEFEAMIASDMIVYKLGGFLYDLGAKLIKVDRKHVEMRVGARRLLPYWGKSPDSQPVLVDLQLGENWDQKITSTRAVTNTTLQVRIRPDGWIKDKKIFKARAEQVLRALKGYFAAK